MYGVVPPVAFTVAVPSAALRHVSPVEEIISAIKSVGSSNVCSSTTSHPFASTTMNEYCPATRSFIVNDSITNGVLTTVAFKSLIIFTKVYGGVPPKLPVFKIPKVTLPSSPPLQLGWLLSKTSILIPVGSVIDTDACAVQPFASVAVTLYPPA